MLSGARSCLRLAQHSVRTFSSRTTPPQGPRGSLSRSPPTQRRAPPARSSSRESSRQKLPSENAIDRPPTSREPSKVEAVSAALARTSDADNPLITPIYIPEDVHGVLRETHPAMRLLDNSAIVIQRQLEMMNVLMGFEQANRYVIMDPHGNHIGYLAERDHGLRSTMARQMFKTHRSFTTHVFDREEKEILRFHRPFSWISSKIRVYDAVGKDESAYTSSVALQGTSAQSALTQTSASVSSLSLSALRIIGSAEQEWALLRRKYNLFLARQLEKADPDTLHVASGHLPLSDAKALTVAEGDNREVGMQQFARVDEPFLSWDFSLLSEDKRLLGSVNRNFVGFARELFTDTGVYALRMDAAGLATEPAHLISHTGDNARSSRAGHPGMTLDQRAVMLATAVSVDFDYFSRHSGSGGMGLWPMWMPWWGGEAAGGAAAGEAGAAGAGSVGAASESGIASEAAGAVRGLGSAEGAVAGAGTMAGYEVMQRSRGTQQQEQVDSQSPQAPDQGLFLPEQQMSQQQEEDVWGQSGQAPFSNKGGDDPWRAGDASEDGADGGGGGGGGFSWGDIFGE